MIRRVTLALRLLLGAVFIYAAYTKLRQSWLLFALSIDLSVAAHGLSLWRERCRARAGAACCSAGCGCANCRSSRPQSSHCVLRDGSVVLRGAGSIAMLRRGERVGEDSVTRRASCNTPASWWYTRRRPSQSKSKSPLFTVGLSGALITAGGLSCVKGVCFGAVPGVHRATAARKKSIHPPSSRCARGWIWGLPSSSADSISKTPARGTEARSPLLLVCHLTDSSTAES